MTLKIQPRDIEVMRALFESRIMERRHLLALFFADQMEFGKKRLRALIAAGYIGEKKRHDVPGHYLPGWLYLSRQGFLALASDPSFERYPSMTWERMQERLKVSSSRISHELGVINGKVAWTEAIRERTDLALVEYATWPALYQFMTGHPSGSMALLKPDARSITRHIRTNDVAVIFHEHDRSTEALERILAKAYGYASYQESGNFVVRMGSARDARKDSAFRVMVDVKSVERRNNIAEALIKEPHVFRFKNLFGLATTKEFLANPLGEIWVTLGDYLLAMKDTAYDPFDHAANCRVSERDRLVEERINKRALFGNEEKNEPHVAKKRSPKESPELTSSNCLE